MIDAAFDAFLRTQWKQSGGREFLCRVDRVVDGDTVDCTVDVGFKVRTKVRVRISGVDTPELFSGDENERIAGLDAKEHLQNLVQSDPFGFVVVTGKQSFSRWIGDVTVGVMSNNPVNVAQHMRDWMFANEMRLFGLSPDG